jgi:mRNA interferase RelE/StbE
MKWRVEIAKTALGQLEKITELRIRKKLFERIEQLENDPESQGKPLRNELSGLLSVRAIGQRYRIIYKLENEHIIVIVVAVGIRKEGDRADIYRIAERLLRSGLMTF